MWQTPADGRINRYEGWKSYLDWCNKNKIGCIWNWTLLHCWHLTQYVIMCGNPVQGAGVGYDLRQGLLKVWTEHSHWFLLNWKLLEISQQKFQHFYNLERNEFSPNLKGVAQKLGPPRPFEVLDAFSGKSKSKAPNAFKFCAKWVPIEVNNWWKFGVDISNHFWEIWNWRFLVPPSVPNYRIRANRTPEFY